jgi:hypothetical protein
VTVDRYVKLVCACEPRDLMLGPHNLKNIENGTFECIVVMHGRELGLSMVALSLYSHDS